MGCTEKRYLITLLSCLGFAFIMLLQILSKMRALKWMYINVVTYDFYTLYRITNVIFFMGQMTSLVGGIISNHYGGVVTFGVAMLLCAGINFSLEFLLRISLGLFIVTKFFDGVMQGLMYSSVADVWSRWTTLQHRSKYVSFTLAGYQLAEVVQVMFFPQENNSLEFVAIGAAIWAIVWLLYVKNDPSQDEHLSNTEKNILQERLKFLDEKSVTMRQYPWLPILKSRPFWALNGAAFINGVSYVIINQTMPYFLPYKTSDDKVLTLVTSLSIFIITMDVGCIVDFIRNKDIANNRKLKIFVCVSFVSQAIILIAFYSQVHYSIVILLLYALALIFRTIAQISIQTIVIDLSPRYASLLNGIQYSFYIFGVLLIDESVTFLRSLPFITAVSGLYFICVLFYYIFGSTKLQSWNGTSKDAQELEEQENRTTVVE